MVVSARIAERFQARSPITNLLARTRLTSMVGRECFQLAESLSPRGGCLADQFHQAQLRLAAPNILAIPEHWTNIGGGIRVRKVAAEELGEVSKPYFDHVRLLEIVGENSGLHAYIAVHSLMEVNGRLWCIGGTRMRCDYQTPDHALRDVLRLSRAMTYKCAAADIPIGGGKCDITCDPNSPKKDAILKDFGKALEYLKVIFTGQDMNISSANARLMGLVAPHGIVGPSDIAMRGLPPTPPTAKGVFVAIKKAAELNGIPLNELTVALQGLGGVGANLVPYLIEAGVKVTATDVSAVAREAVRDKFGDKITVLDNPDDIYKVKAQLFSCSAREDVLNDVTIPLLAQSGVKMLVGAANNPLTDDVKHAKMLQEFGIFYYRDFVVNGGGLMAVASGVMGYDPMIKVEGIAGSVERLHQLMLSGKTGHEAGEIFAGERLAQWKRFTSQGWQNPA